MTAPLSALYVGPNHEHLTGAARQGEEVAFDTGTHPVRIGSRQGPAAIREQSYLVRPYEPPLFDFNPLVELGVMYRNPGSGGLADETRECREG